jgi:hypothetical protein
VICLTAVLGALGAACRLCLSTYSLLY